MDRRKPAFSRRALVGRIDADAAPTDSGREGSSVIYFGNAQRVSEGFAIALDVMEVGADILPTDLAPPNTSFNLEDN
jgi:hypothetical protein